MKGERGFTLLEVMISLVIIATAFIVLLHSRNQSILMGDYARHMTEATLLSSQKMAEIEQEDFPDTGEEEGEFGEEHPGYRWRSEVVETPLETIREVRVSVLWGEGTGERSVDLVSYARAKK